MGNNIIPKDKKKVLQNPLSFIILRVIVSIIKNGAALKINPNRKIGDNNPRNNFRNS